jgi:hypothetical protein
MNTQNSIIVGEIMLKEFCKMTPFQKQVSEGRVVNNAKMRMIKRIETLCEEEGYENALRLFLVPVFTIAELKKMVTDKAPELINFFYKELIESVEEYERIWINER